MFEKILESTSFVRFFDETYHWGYLCSFSNFVKINFGQLNKDSLDLGVQLCHDEGPIKERPVTSGN